MNNNMYKKIFFSNLFVVLIVISNLIGLKYINFNGLIVSSSLITLSFTYLCLLLINNYTNKKEMWLSLFSSVFIQIIMIILYSFITNFNSQNIIPDLGSFINIVFKTNIFYVLINIVSLLISSFVLHYIYEYFRIIGYKLLGTVLSILSALILYGLISIPIINYEYGMLIILDMIMGHLLISSFMTIILTILFYLLKEKEYPYNDNKLFIKDINLYVPKNKTDKSIDEVLKITNKLNEKNVKKKKNNDKNKYQNKSKRIVKNNNSSKKDVKK